MDLSLRSALILITMDRKMGYMDGPVPVMWPALTLEVDLSCGKSTFMEMEVGGPCDKTEKEDEMNADQPTTVSSQSLSIQTER